MICHVMLHIYFLLYMLFFDHDPLLYLWIWIMPHALGSHVANFYEIEDIVERGVSHLDYINTTGKRKI